MLELVKQAKCGNMRAIEDIILVSKPIVLCVARKCFLTSSEQGDLIQEGTLGVLKAIKEFDESKNDNFKSYVYICVKSRIFDFIRNANSSKHRALSDSAELVVSIEDPKANLLDAYLDKERIDLIFDVLEKTLSNTELKIFKSYLDGDCYDSIATTFNINTKKVDNTIAKAKKLAKMAV